MEPTNDDTTIRKVLAEFMGWDDFWEADQSGRHWLMGMHPSHQGYYALENDRIEVPDYAADLNAMHEVEQELKRRGLHEMYVDLLVHAVWQQRRNTEYWQNEGYCPYPDRQRWFYEQYFDYAHATASERARAAYAVIKAQQEAKGND